MACHLRAAACCVVLLVLGADGLKRSSASGRYRDLVAPSSSEAQLLQAATAAVELVVEKRTKKLEDKVQSLEAENLRLKEALNAADVARREREVTADGIMKGYSAVPICSSWCAGHADAWSSKCAWSSKLCSSCADCFGGMSSPALATVNLSNEAANVSSAAKRSNATRRGHARRKVVLMSQRGTISRDDWQNSTAKRLSSYPLAEKKPDLMEWCYKLPYSLDYESAAFKLSNATSGPNMSEEKRTGIYHLHTPKVAGVSFGEDLVSILPTGMTLDSHEGCYSDVTNMSIGVVMMVRAPRQHVFSQYSFCATSPDIGPSHMRDLMPGSFEYWIQNWTDLVEQEKAFGNFTVGPKTAYNDPWCFSTLPYACYSPVNLQSQRLTCNAGRAYDYPEHQDLDLLLKNLDESYFVGVVEAYQESVCLLHAKVRGKLPHWCDCNNSEKWKSAPVHQEDHGAKHDDGLADFSASILEQVDNLTRADRILYVKATERFLREIDEVEMQYQKKILCRELPSLPGAPVEMLRKREA